MRHRTGRRTIKRARRQHWGYFAVIDPVTGRPRDIQINLLPEPLLAANPDPAWDKRCRQVEQQIDERIRQGVN